MLRATFGEVLIWRSAVGAGDSAATESARSRRAADRLRRRAAFAEKRADDFAKGEMGERMVEAALAPLESQGWRFLHDRRHPEGGNVDHIAIGPPGVAVLDAKNWTSPVTITPDRRLVASKFDHTAVVDKLNDTLDLLRRLLSQDGVRVAA
jgi:hypothetical protein